MPSSTRSPTACAATAPEGLTRHRTWTWTASLALFAKPPRLHAGSTGWTAPESSVARASSTWSPGSASHSQENARHACRPGEGASSASVPVRARRRCSPRPVHRAPPGPGPPRQQHRPGGSTRSRVMKSGNPGGTAAPAARSGSAARRRRRGAAASGRRWCWKPSNPSSETLDDGQPLHARHAVPPRHHEPGREAVLRRQRAHRSSRSRRARRAAAPRPRAARAA